MPVAQGRRETMRFEQSQTKMQPQRILRISIQGDDAPAQPAQLRRHIGCKQGLADAALGRCETNQRHSAPCSPKMNLTLQKRLSKHSLRSRLTYLHFRHRSIRNLTNWHLVTICATNRGVGAWRHPALAGAAHQTAWHGAVPPATRTGPRAAEQRIEGRRTARRRAAQGPGRRPGQALRTNRQWLPPAATRHRGTRPRPPGPAPGAVRQRDRHRPLPVRRPAEAAARAAPAPRTASHSRECPTRRAARFLQKLRHAARVRPPCGAAWWPARVQRSQAAERKAFAAPE